MRMGGWQGSMGTVGGVSRTYGLHKIMDRQSNPDFKFDRSILKRVSTYLTPYRWLWAVIITSIAIISFLAVLPPFCVRHILDVAIPKADTHLLVLLSLAMVGLTLLSGLIGVLQQSLTAHVGQGIMHDIRNHLFKHLQSMSLSFYTNTRSGEIVSRVNNDVNAIQGVVTGTIVSLISNSTTLLATSIALLSMNWRLALLAIVVVPAFYFPSRLIGRVSRDLSAQSQAQQANLLSFLQERLHVGGTILQKIFGQGPRDAELFSHVSTDIRRLSIKRAVVGRWLFMVLSVFSTIGPAAIYAYGGLEVIKGNLSIGQLIAFVALLTLLYRPLMQLASMYVDIQSAVAVFTRIFEYLDLNPEVEDSHQPIAITHTQGHLLLEQVCFSYPEPPPPPAGWPQGLTHFNLQNISFEIKPGEHVALVGPSGAGKSTLTYLLPRFYDPSHGRILLDGHDLKALDQTKLREQFAMVTQDTFLFHSSIRDNLLYAKPDCSQTQLEDSCKAANIHHFIQGLPLGYDTIVGERGFKLSGGEKQRLSIARALLKDPKILILDEATSNLDPTSEFLIQEALDNLLQGRTALIIAHRLSTILGVDRIIVLDSGRVVQSGSHAELIDQLGLYAQFFQQQFSKVLAGKASPLTAQ